MNRHWVILAALALSTAAAAQTADFAYGHGRIRVGDHNAGAFDFGVSKYNGNVNGQLHYAEVTPTGTVAVGIGIPHVLAANFAEHAVEFAGPGVIFSNGGQMNVLVHVGAAEASTTMPAVFGIEARDSSGNVVYHAGGPLVDGRIYIIHRHIFSLFAEGYGGIGVTPNTVGHFSFGVRSDGMATEGSLSYAEGNMQGVVAAIFVPAVQHSMFTEHSVTFEGPGGFRHGGMTTNVMVHVEATDSPPGTPDTFSITAFDEHGMVVYHAGGNLLFGRIIVGQHMDSDAF